MSHDAVDRFLALLKDATMRERLGLNAKVSTQRFVQLGAEHGCSFTENELRTHFSASARPLSDEELEGVSGGVGGAASFAGATLTLRLPGAAAKGGGYNEITLDDTAGKER